jgi:SPP1 family predicted phage head-tail adaptor
MRSGKYRHRLTLQAKTQQQDPATGAMLPPVWSDFATVWGAFASLSAREFIAAGAAQSEVVARAEIRYRPGIDASMRLLHRGDVYVLTAPPLPDAKSGREHLTLLLAHGVRDD